MMGPPIPVHEFKPETNRSYLVFCPEQGGWHVGEWWTIDGPGRWLLALDAATELMPSHVMDVPPDALDPTGAMWWTAGRQLRTEGSA